MEHTLYVLKITTNSKTRKIYALFLDLVTYVNTFCYYFTTCGLYFTFSVWVNANCKLCIALSNGLYITMFSTHLANDNVNSTILYQY